MQEIDLEPIIQLLEEFPSKPKPFLRAVDNPDEQAIFIVTPVVPYEEIERVTQPKSKKLGFVIAAVVIGLLAYLAISKLIFSKKEGIDKEVIDSIQPVATISGIASQYRVGDTVYFTVRAEDDKRLKKLNFLLKKGPWVISGNTKLWTIESWVISGKTDEKSFSFSTKGFKPGTYNYSVYVEDKAGNGKTYHGSFALVQIETSRKDAEVNHRAAVESVVFRYPDIKKRGTGDRDISVWNLVLTDPMLEKQRQSTCWLIKNNQYYTFSEQRVTIINIMFEDNYNYATVLADISEIRGRFKDNGTPIQSPQFDQYRAVYQLKRMGNNWFIYCLKSLKQGEPVECSVELTEPDPCSE